MARPYTQLYCHLAWATWNRLPLISPAVEHRLYEVVKAEFQQMQCLPIAVGGLEDHLHCLIAFPVTKSIAEIVKQVKGASSHLMTHEVIGPDGFKWQGSYAAFTVARNSLDRVGEYVNTQKERHASGDVYTNWERTADEEPHPATHTE